ncbi:12832_t:CDS:2 [Racocetra persica]|uniref:12832_t:CDS:1 n=1 Tax=Racocetra persica TaxID=160502 RepID=A0ACA9KJG1_9GLOM|nr:12832_t:CDS:2 [Racocetra persica]
MESLEKFKGSKTSVTSPLDLLPDEIWLRIFIELPVSTLCRCRTVSKKCYSISLDETIWQHHSAEFFEPGPLPPRTKSSANSWEKFYRIQRNWNRGTATKVSSFKAHNNNVTALKLRGNILVTGSSEYRLKVWNIKTGKPDLTIDFGADISCVDFLEDMDVIACGSYYGDFGCKLFSLSKGECLGRFIEDHWIGTQCMAMNKEYIVLGTCKGVIHVLSWADGRRVALFHNHPKAVAGVRLLGRNTLLSVSTNGTIDVFDIAMNELLHQYTLPSTSISTCAFDYQGEGRDLLCIAPSGSIFHLRWTAVYCNSKPSQCSEIEEDKKYRYIFSQDPEVHYKNEKISYRTLCAGMDAKYNHGVIGSLVSYPPRSHLLVYNSLKGLSSKDGICGPNSLNAENGTLDFTPDTDSPVFNILGIDDERVVAGCSRGFIYCFEFGFNDSKEFPRFRTPAL